MPSLVLEAGGLAKDQTLQSPWRGSEVSRQSLASEMDSRKTTACGTRHGGLFLLRPRESGPFIHSLTH